MSRTSLPRSRAPSADLPSICGAIPWGAFRRLSNGDGITMFESAAICLQLADLNPAAGLIPPLGSAERALVYQWVVFAVAELEAPLFGWIGELGEGTMKSPARDRHDGIRA